MEFPNFTTNIDTATGKETEWSGTEFQENMLWKQDAGDLKIEIQFGSIKRGGKMN